MPGAEVHVEGQGKMVVTVEGPNEGFIADRMTAMHLLDGVLSAVLVFHHVEPAEGAGSGHV
jgi:periplasmic nitrate reductase NapD